MSTPTKDAVTKEVAALIGEELRAHAEKLFAKHGLQIKKSKSTYGDGFSWKIEADGIDLNEDGINLASEEAQYYTKFGFSYYSVDEHQIIVLNAPLGMKFTLKGEEYLFAGVARRKQKFPILAIRVRDKKQFGFSQTLALRLNEWAGN